MFDEKKAKEMCKRGYPWAHIAKALGVSPDVVRRRLDPGYAQGRNRLVQEARARKGDYRSQTGGTYRVHDRIDEEVIAERFAEIPDDTRDLTARIMGDPLPGRSALDQHNQ